MSATMRTQGAGIILVTWIMDRISTDSSIQNPSATSSRRHQLYGFPRHTKSNDHITQQLINVIGSGTVITPLRRSSKEKSVTTFSVRNVLLYNILYFSSLLFDLSQHMPAQQVLGQINHDPALMVSNWTQSSLRQPTMCPGPWSIKHGLSDL